MTTDADDKSDWKVVSQFFIVPLGLVAVLVSVFFGLQVLRTRHPDARSTLEHLKGPSRFLLPWVGDPKRWQSGYDLSLAVRAGSGEGGEALAPEMAAAFREAGADPKLRRYLALALGRSGEASAVPALKDGMRDPDGETRLYCAWGLMEIADRSSLPELRAAVGDQDEAVRTLAVFALGELGDHDGAAALRPALQDASMSVRWNAALSLARLGDDAGESILIGVLQGKETAEQEQANASARLNAIRGLALLGGPAARAALQQAAETGASDVIRATARLGLKTIAAKTPRPLP